MADKKISDLTAATSLASGDFLELENAGGNSRKITASNAAGSLQTLAHRGALVYRSTAQTAQNYTGFITMIPFDAESYDTDSFHDTVSNTTRISIPSGVTKVRLSAGIIVNNINSSLWGRAFIYKNGSGTDYPGIGEQTGWSSALGSMYLNPVTSVISVVGGTDYFEVGFQVQTDISVDIAANSWFSVQVIAA